jgi:HD-GYP domain-containing protein (c-di-GMP phosphodiesterase class II)
MVNELAETDRAAGEAFRRLAASVDAFEGYEHPHASRVARLSDELARHFGLSRADRTSLVHAALLHDLGEMAMKRDYIGRAGPLNEEERLDLARHPVIGEQESARSGADRAVQLLVRWHHEWWNGSGYPDCLRAEQIPLKARILRVADSYAALTDSRPWRPAGTEAEARKHLTLWAGLEFDPAVVRAFLSLRDIPELRSYARASEPPPATEPQPSSAPDVQPVVTDAQSAESASAEEGNRREEAAGESPREPVEVVFGQAPTELEK